MGQPPSGSGETFRVLHGVVVRRLRAYDDRQIGACEEFTRQLLEER